MPQFDFAIFPSQVFWLVVTFGVLYLLLARLALPKIADALETRQRKIDDDLERATEIEQQAKEVMAAYEAALDKARDEALSVVRKSSEETALAGEARQQALSGKLADEVAAAEARVGAAKSEALGDLRQVASETARAAVLRLIGAEVGETQADAAVAATMGDKG